MMIILIYSWLHYFGIIKTQESVDADCLTDNMAYEIASKCKDFSGREISKVWIILNNL